MRYQINWIASHINCSPFSLWVWKIVAQVVICWGQALKHFILTILPLGSITMYLKMFWSSLLDIALNSDRLVKSRLTDPSHPFPFLNLSIVILIPFLVFSCFVIISTLTDLAVGWEQHIACYLNKYSPKMFIVSSAQPIFRALIASYVYGLFL